jgi:hypothetical protein
MPYDARLTLKTSGIQNASTSGTPIDLGSDVPNGGQLMQFDLYWNQIAGGTPSVDIIIEESPDQNTWRQVTQFRTLVANDNTFVGPNVNGRKMPRFGLATQRYVRYRSVLGTGSSIGFALYAFGMDAVGRDLQRMTF